MGKVHFLAHNSRVIVEPYVERDFASFHRPRGRIGCLSKYARRRLMALFYSFKELPFKTFWTFTFEKDVTPDYAKKELDRINKIFNRRGIGWLWVMEFTKKGRIHFHYAITKCLKRDWMAKKWGHGFVYVSIIFAESGLRKYFVKEVSKNNQKGFHGYCGRWWGVCRALNKKYSLGIYDDSFLVALAKNRGFKFRYWREDLEGIIDNPYANFNNFADIKAQELKAKLKARKDAGPVRNGEYPKGIAEVDLGRLAQEHSDEQAS